MVWKIGFAAAIGLSLLIGTAGWASQDAPPPDFPKFEPKPCEVAGSVQEVPGKVAYIVPGTGVVTSIFYAKTNSRPRQGHYIVTEWCGGAKATDGNCLGILPVAEASGTMGPNCYVQANTFSSSIGSSYSVASIGPLKVTNMITVEWDPGATGEPEPSEGLTLRLFHDCRTYTETQGAGIGKIIGSAKARVSARTRGPGKTCFSQSESQAPLVGAEADPRGDSLIETIYGLHSGWKDYLMAEISGVAGSWLIGCARAEATAEITWKAECNSADTHGQKRLPKRGKGSAQ